MFEGFQTPLWGILASGSCRGSRIASANPLTGATPHAERRIRRLVHGQNKRAKLEGEALSAASTEQGAKRLRNEPEVMLSLDGSDPRKPHSRKLEYLDTVPDVAGDPVSGFHTLNVLGIGESGQRALLYPKTLAPGFKSVNDEYQQAMNQVSRALRKEGAGRLLWVLDRAFDALKLMRMAHEDGQCCILRVQHPERQILGPQWKPQRLNAALAAAPKLGQLEVERVWFDPQTKRRRALSVEVYGMAVRPLEAPGLPLSALLLHHPKLASPGACSPTSPGPKPPGINGPWRKDSSPSIVSVGRSRPSSVGPRRVSTGRA